MRQGLPLNPIQRQTIWNLKTQTKGKKHINFAHWAQMTGESHPLQPTHQQRAMPGTVIQTPKSRFWDARGNHTVACILAGLNTKMGNIISALPLLHLGLSVCLSLLDQLLSLVYATKDVTTNYTWETEKWLLSQIRFVTEWQSKNQRNCSKLKLSFFFLVKLKSSCSKRLSQFSQDF